jgi:hypothetical protein
MIRSNQRLFGRVKPVADSKGEHKHARTLDQIYTKSVPTPCAGSRLGLPLNLLRRLW